MRDDQPRRPQRPQSMQTVARHSKVRVDVLLDETAWVAGQAITGQVEMTTSASHGLRLGQIAVELDAFEGA